MKKSNTKSRAETRALGKNLAKEILMRKTGETAVVLGLKGDLGAGKTTFLQGFARGLDIKENILSPTFVIMKKLNIKNKNFKNFYHIDCYRLKNEKDLEILGFKEIIKNSQNIVAIEWPERISNMLPKNTFKIKFSHPKENRRQILLP